MSVLGEVTGSPETNPHRAQPPLWLLGPVAVLGWGVVAGWWTPRGPVTTTDALSSILLSLGVGFLAGALTRSRWAMLLAPVLFAATVELVRIGFAGPTVDAPHESALGVLALLVGRGVHGLLALLPLFVGAAYGAGFARRRAGSGGGGRFRRYTGRVVVGLLAALLALVAGAVAIPARTAAIDGGIAELTRVDGLGMLIRGSDRTAPVLLFQPGSPGGSEIGAMRRRLADLERHFVVATVDRRGGGKSYGALDPTSTLTLDDEIETTVALTNYLRERFGQDKIYLVGHSGSTIQGVLAAQRHPELYHAYVGAAQVVNLTTADRSQYEQTLAWARTNDAELASTLAALGPPPYDTVYDYEPMLLAEGRVYAYPGSADAGNGQFENFEVDEHSLLDKMHVMNGFLDSYGVLYPREKDVDLLARVPSLAVPAYFVDGAHDVPGRLAVMEPWYDALRAPRKERVTFPDAGHRSPFEKPAEFVALMARVRSETGA
jgi:proline iminopeptidase